MVDLELQEADIVAYLAAHPGFFQKYPQLLDNLEIHHEARGAISLVEMKLQRQHEQLARQKEEFSQLSQVAIHNENMFFSLFPLQQKLCDAQDFKTGMSVLQTWSTEFSLKQGRVLLCRDIWQESEFIPDDYWIDRSAFEVIRAEKFGLQRFYLGILSTKDKSLLFLPKDLPVGSVAFSLLGKKSGHLSYAAVLQFSAFSTNHFYRGQDTSFLLQLSELIESHLARWLSKKSPC